VPGKGTQLKLANQMKSKTNDAGLASLCHEVRPDDGVPPHILQKQHRTGGRGSKPDFAALRFTKAAVRAVEAALAAYASDADLGSLSVAGALLHPGGAVLEVTLLAPEHRHDDIPALEERLHALSGHFRAQIAAEVNRRRTPHLRLRAIPGTV
jgi:hypothetical protein